MIDLLEYFLSLPLVDQLGLSAMTAVQIACVSVIMVLGSREFKQEV